MKWIRWFRRRLLYGGSSLKSYERRVIEAAASTMVSSDAAMVLRQVVAIEAVQRTLNGRHGKIMYGDDKATLPRLGDQELTVSVKLHTPFGRTRAAVSWWHGLLFTIEFGKPPKQFLAGGFDVVAANRTDSWRGPAEAANRLEHGPDGAA